MFKCVCGRVFVSKCSRSAHYKHCQMYRDIHNMCAAPKPFVNKQGENPGYGWNKGLTAKTDARVKNLVKTRHKSFVDGDWVPYNRGKRSNKVVMYAGYKAVYLPEHHMAQSNGLVFEHVLVAENKLNRLLLPNEVVHHRDRNKLNNEPHNIVVFQDRNNHARYYECKKHHTEYVLKRNKNGSWKCIKL